MPLLVTAPVVLVALLLTLVMLVENRSTVSELTSESVQQVHLRIAQRLTTLMASTERVGLVVAGLVENGYLDPDDLPGWKNHLLTQSAALPELSGVTWGDRQGRTVWIARFPGEEDLQLCLKARPDEQARRFRLQADGQLDPEPVAVYDYDPRQRPWYQKAAEKDAPVWLEPYTWTSRSGAKPVVAVAIARPVHDHGRLLGVVNCTFTLPHLSDFLATLQVGHGGTAFILDQSGQLIASGLAPEAPLLEAALALRDEDEFSWQGARYLLVRSAFRYPEGLEQTVVTVVPEADLAAGAYRARLKALWVTVGAVVVSLLVGLKLASTIVGPIAGLVEQVQQLEKSRQPAAMPPELAQRSDEFGRLSQALMSLSQAVRQAEETLRQREEYYRSLIENSSDITLVLDAHDKISYASPAIERLELTADAVRGRALPELVEAEQAESVRAGLARARETESTFPLDFCLNGRWLQALVSGDGQGGLVLNSRDVTERRRLSELEHEKAALEATTRARTGFLAHITHELRTPMNSIIGFTDMLRRRLRELPERDRDSLETIDRNAKHLLGIINDLLDISKVEAGKVELCPEEFSLEALARDVMAAVAPLAARTNSRCHLTIGEDPGVLNSDPTRIRQILYNLLSNACKFTHEGEVELHLSGDRDRVTVVVQDDGIGIAADHLERIFEPFTQADSTITRRFGGTGLGLALSKSFCEMLGGEISVESELGKGSRFTVRLPRRLASA
ncbi:MAG: PAS domain S-box protein [Candidatus Eremiobacteraeota bacterium]|nr:PAS domain S-box protein [Candidatus Eremiobacteraeota bacterium]